MERRGWMQKKGQQRQSAEKTGKRTGRPSDEAALRYPILLMHGIGFRDDWKQAYWGRIPQALEAHGAVVYYGGQEAWGALYHNAALAKCALVRALKESGAEKVHIIAHSKGGLEARCLIQELGMAPYVASLTTICTPHHGSRALDLYEKVIPRPMRDLISLPVEGVFHLLGDDRPDFSTTLHQLTTTESEKRNRRWDRTPPPFPCWSYGAYTDHAWSDWMYLATWPIIQALEGKNDGLVSVASAQWGRYGGTLHSRDGQGVSHGDAVNLRGKVFPEGTIADFYVGLLVHLRAAEADEEIQKGK